MHRLSLYTLAAVILVSAACGARTNGPDSPADNVKPDAAPASANKDTAAPPKKFDMGPAGGMAGGSEIPGAAGTSGASDAAAADTNTPADVAPAIGTPDTAPPATGKLMLYVGGNDTKLSTFTVDEATGALAAGATLTPGKNPWYLKAWKNRRLYVALDGEASLVAYDIDAKTGALQNARGAMGNAAATTSATPVSIAIDDDGRFAVTGDYGGTTTLYPLKADGAPEKGTAMSSGGNTHDVAAVGNFVFSGSMAAKRVNQYRFDAATKTLTNNTPAVVSNDCAARGMTSHPNGRLILVMCHTPISLMTYLLDATKGTLTVADAGKSPLPAGSATANSSGAEVVLHPNGRIVYTSVVNGGGANNYVTTFELDTTTGALRPMAYMKAASTPRGIAVDPAGKFVFAASQDDGGVTVYDVQADGTLKLKRTTAKVGSGPVGLGAVRLAP